MVKGNPQPPVRNSVGDARRRLGISAADLAHEAGVSRQTIHAIEAGAYVPNTAVALRLAAALHVAVEELFQLDCPLPEDAPAAVDLLAAAPVPAGQAVRLCRVGDREVAVACRPEPGFLPAADALVRRVRKGGRAELALVTRPRADVERLVVAGCDPAVPLIGSMLEPSAKIELVAVSVSSRVALEWLHEKKVHIAGAHLRDSATGEFNLPVLKRDYPRDDVVVVTFAHWEEGLVCAPGNPKRLRGVADLARRGVRFVNRDPGSGSRTLLDRLLQEAGVPPRRVRGYGDVALGHLAAANRVFTGAADACLAARSAALAFGLDFVPLERERYDLIIRREMLPHAGVRVLLDVLQRAALRRKLSLQAGYDTTGTGSVLAG